MIQIMSTATTKSVKQKNFFFRLKWLYVEWNPSHFKF